MINAHLLGTNVHAGLKSGKMNVAFVTNSFGPHITIIATRDIKEGEELLTDYGPDYNWSRK